MLFPICLVLATTLGLGSPTAPTSPPIQFATVQAIRTPADTTLYKDYVGKYAMKDAPFQTVIVTIENGKLMGEAVDQGKGELVADDKVADQFSVPGYDAIVAFVRGADRKVTKVNLTVQGQTFEGEKQP
jgi:hypothetical protein